MGRPFGLFPRAIGTIDSEAIGSLTQSLPRRRPDRLRTAVFHEGAESLPCGTTGDHLQFLVAEFGNRLLAGLDFSQNELAYFLGSHGLGLRLLVFCLI